MLLRLLQQRKIVFLHKSYLFLLFYSIEACHECKAIVANWITSKSPGVFFILGNCLSMQLFHTIEGGAIIINDAALLEKARLMRNFGIDGQDSVKTWGINAKMNEFEAAFSSG